MVYFKKKSIHNRVKSQGPNTDNNNNNPVILIIVSIDPRAVHVD